MFVLRPNLLVCIFLLYDGAPSHSPILAENLTQWGYNDCTRHLNNGAFGSMLPKRTSEKYPPVNI